LREERGRREEEELGKVGSSHFGTDRHQYLSQSCFLQVYCAGPEHLYNPCNFDDSAASEYGGYTMAELR